MAESKRDPSVYALLSAPVYSKAAAVNLVSPLEGCKEQKLIGDALQTTVLHRPPQNHKCNLAKFHMRIHNAY